MTDLAASRAVTDPHTGPTTAEPQPLEPGWVDLASNRPGEQLRKQAQLELAAMRQRSRFRTFLVRAVDGHTQERAWRRGAEGEEAVASRLTKLEKRGWRFLHSVPVGTRGSDIDHVAIGPGGVFTLNTKNHRGKKVWVGTRQIRVNGHPVDYLRNSRFEAERSTRMLTEACGFPVFVTALIVVLADELNIKQQPEPVLVVGRRNIAGWLRKRPDVLAPDQIAAVYECARRSTTWT